MTGVVTSHRRHVAQRTREAEPIPAALDTTRAARTRAATPSTDPVEQDVAVVENLAETVPDAREASDVAHAFGAVKVAAPPAGSSGDSGDSSDDPAAKLSTICEARVP